MSNSKISALTSATTPLAGTETLPIVQSSTTKQVSVANLTAGRAVSVFSLSATGTITVNNTAATSSQYLNSIGSTTGNVYQSAANTGGAYVFGIESSGGNSLLPGASAYSTVLYNSTNTPVIIGSNNAIVSTFSSTGLAVTGLIDISAATSGQIKFPATQNASTNATTLDDYEEGTWTPIDSSGAGLSFTGVAGFYVKVGKLVMASCQLTYPTTASGATAIIGGLPFASGSNGTRTGFVSYTSNATVTGTNFTLSGSTQLYLNGGGSLKTNVNVTGSTFYLAASYISA